MTYVYVFPVETGSQTGSTLEGADFYNSSVLYKAWPMSYLKETELWL